MFLRSGWYQWYFGVDSVSLSTFGIFPATRNNSPGHVSNHRGKVPPHLPTLGACGLRCLMSRGGSSQVVGCVFVARPGQCGTHHDVLVWTPVNAHFILRRICHTAFDMFSATGTSACFVNLRMAPVRGMHVTEVAVGVMHTRSVELASPGWRCSFNSFRDYSMMPLRTPYSWSMSRLRCASEYALVIHTATSMCFQFALTLVSGARCCEDIDVDVKDLDSVWNRVPSSTWTRSVRGLVCVPSTVGVVVPPR